MREYLIFGLLMFCCVLRLSAKKQLTGNIVLFGENTKKMSACDSNTLRVYMDKNGDYYPPGIFINDDALYKSGGSMRDWYHQNPDFFNTVCQKFNVPERNNIDDRMTFLNKTICLYYANIINLQPNKHVFMLVHGFRKRAYYKPDLFTYLATTDNTILKETINNMTTEDNNIYLEIYWDACYFKPAKAMKDEGFVIFRDLAVANANKVGLALRQLIIDLNTQKINVVTHSLGARVACNLLFNVNSVDESYPMIQADKKVKVCFIAPAIGSELFENFYHRSAKLEPATSTDNYEICIVYNRFDYLLRKQGRILGITFTNRDATAFANTSLGCDYNNDINRLKYMFKTQFRNTKPPTIVDVTRGKSITNHLVKKYCKNPKFKNLLWYQ